MGKSKDLATGETRFVNTAGDTMTGTLVAGTRLQVGDSSITQEYTQANFGYVADFQATTGSQTFISIAPPNVSSLGDNGTVIGEDGSDTYITQRNNKNIKLGTSNVNRLIIDGSGRVTTPSQPSFLARGNTGNWVSVSSGNEQNVAFGNVVFDVGSNFSTSNNRFTAPVAGKYLFHFHCYLRLTSSDDDTNYATTRFYKNGNVYENYHNIRGYNNSGDSDQISPLTAIIDLAATDYVTAGCKANSGGMEFYQPNCNFTGYLLG